MSKLNLKYRKVKIQIMGKVPLFSNSQFLALTFVQNLFLKVAIGRIEILVHICRPVQDTFEKYLDTDTFSKKVSRYILF